MSADADGDARGLLAHERRGERDCWRTPAGNSLVVWMPRPHVFLSEARGHFEVALARAFIAYVEPRTGSTPILGLHDWSGVTGYDTDTRKVFTRWTDAHRKDFSRIVIYTDSRLVRMGIATAKLVLGSIVEAVGTRAQLDRLIADATR